MYILKGDANMWHIENKLFELVLTVVSGWSPRSTLSVCQGLGGCKSRLLRGTSAFRAQTASGYRQLQDL